jgi:hypothetical protein
MYPRALNKGLLSRSKQAISEFSILGVFESSWLNNLSYVPKNVEQRPVVPFKVGNQRII